MELHHIKDAMRGQFVWKRLERRENESLDDFEERVQDHHRLICDKEYECVAQMALIVFVGLCFQYGFPNYRVRDYLEIDQRTYNNCMKLFNKYSEIARNKAELHILDFTTPAGRLYLKTSLIRNYLKRHGLAA